jgi:ribosome-associated protein
MIVLEIRNESIELCKALKLAGMTSSGGAAKVQIADGRVQVNGVVETRKRKKITFGDIVEFAGAQLKVVTEKE